MVARPGRTAAPAASHGPRRRPPLLGASYTAGARILRVLPPGVRDAAAVPGGSAWFWLSRGQRRAAMDNYSAALGLDRSNPEVARVARRAFQNYGRMVIDFLLMGSLTRDEVIQRTTVDGREHMDAAYAQGRGVILALPHMGSWDNTGMFGGALGYPVSAVTERFPGSLNDAVVRTRLRNGLQVILLSRAALRETIQALHANRLVGLVCDLEQGPGVEVRFFGRRAVVPGGPAALALKTGAALMTGYQYMPGSGRHHLHLDPALSWPDGETKEDLMQRIVHRFEEFIRARPEHWFAFRPIFKSDSEAPPDRRASAPERG